MISFLNAWNLFISGNIIEEVFVRANEFIVMQISHAHLEDLYATDGTSVSILSTTYVAKMNPI